MSENTALVYISYARGDGLGNVQRIAEALTNSGQAAWYDVQDRPDDYEDYASILEGQILRAGCVVICLTNTPMDIRMKREVYFAHAAHKPIFIAAFSEPVPPLLQGATRVDFSLFDAALAKLANLTSNLPDETPTPAFISPYRTYLNRLYVWIVRYQQATVLTTPLTMPEGEWEDAVQNDLRPRRALLRAYQGKPINQPLKDFNTFDMDDEDEMEDFIIMPKAFARLQEALEEYDNRTVIHGESGVGKTTALLYAAREAVLRRLEDSSAPLPFVGMVGGWYISDPRQLYALLGQHAKDLSHDLIQNDLEAGNVVLFLDGFDELGSRQYELIKVQTVDPKTGQPNMLTVKDKDGQKKKIFQEVDQYRHYDPRERLIAALKNLPDNVQFILTMDTHTFEAFSSKLPCQNAIHMQPVLINQMEDFLSAYPHILTLLRRSPNLETVAQKPFLLNALIVAVETLEETAVERFEAFAEQTDAILTEITLRLYAHARHLSASDAPPMSIDALYYVLGAAAFSYVEEADQNPRYGYCELDYTALTGLYHDPDTFIGFAQQLGFLVYVRDDNEGNPIYRFPTAILRDHFIPHACEFLLSDDNILQLRLRALRVLSRVDAVYIQRLILKALDDDELITELQNVNWDARVKAHVLAMLGRSYDARALAPLVTGLEDPQGWVRQSAALALGELGDVGALEALKRSALNDLNADVRRNARRSLEKLGYDPILQPLAEKP